MPRALTTEKLDFVHTGPQTLAGRYLRRFWQPLYTSNELAAERAVPVRVMNEDFTLYRGQSGKAHLLASKCAHRGAQLSVGEIEGDSIRCFFHGWRYESNGRCVEQPGESVPFCHKIKVASYPVQEYLGCIWAYLGEGTAPTLPRWPELESNLPGDGLLDPTVDTITCNYFQHMENIVDEVHIPFTHRNHPLTLNRDIPRITAVERSFGLLASVHHAGISLRTNFMLPNQCYISLYSPRFTEQELFKDEPPQILKTLFCYVPIDDVSHLHFQIILWPPGWRTPQEIGPLPPARPHYEAILAGTKRLSDVMDHANLGRIQDGISLVGQGAIADRRNERLGTSDAAIILLRKIWIRQLKRLAAGQPPALYDRPDPEELSEHDRFLINSWAEEGATLVNK